MILALPLNMLGVLAQAYTWVHDLGAPTLPLPLDMLRGLAKVNRRVV
jgi:hypothetical protein